VYTTKSWRKIVIKESQYYRQVQASSIKSSKNTVLLSKKDWFFDNSYAVFLYAQKVSWKNVYVQSLNYRLSKIDKYLFRRSIRSSK